MKKPYYTYPVRLVGLLLCVAVLLLTLLFTTGEGLLPSPMLDVDRTMEMLEQLDKGAHPRGSAANDQVREELVALISEAGGEPVEMAYQITNQDMNRYAQRTRLYPASSLTNVLVEIPGRRQDVVLVVAHYDSVSTGPGISDNLVSVANAVQAAQRLLQGEEAYDNTIVFLFTDGEEEGMLGAHCFVEPRVPTEVRVGGQVADADQRSHYTALIDRVKFVINLESRGTAGQTLLFETASGDANAMAAFAGRGKGIYMSGIASFIYRQMQNNTDFTPFAEKGIRGVNFANIGEGYYYHTQSDDMAHLRQGTVIRDGNALMTSLSAYGGLSMDVVYRTSEDSIFFDYLGLFSVALPTWVGWIASGLILILFLFWLARATKVHGGGRVARRLILGTVVVVLGLVAGAFAAQGLSMLLATGGEWLAERLASSLYMSEALYLGMLCGALCVAVLVWGLLAKLFLLTGRALREAAVFLVSLLGVVCAFALPQAAYIFLPAAVIGLVLMILTTVRLGKDPAPLGLYALCFAAYIPLGGSISILASYALGAPLLYLLLIPMMLGFALILPYVLDIPTRRRFLVLMGSVLLLLVCGVALLGAETSSPVRSDITASITGYPSGKEDDRLIYVMDMDEDTVAFEIRDMDMARPLMRQLLALGFQEEEGGMRKLEEAAMPTNKPSLLAQYDDVQRATVLTVRPSSADSQWVVYFPASGVSSVTYTKDETPERILLGAASRDSQGMASIADTGEATLAFASSSKLGNLHYVEYLDDAQAVANTHTAQDVLALDDRIHVGVELTQTVSVP